MPTTLSWSSTTGNPPTCQRNIISAASFNAVSGFTLTGSNAGRLLHRDRPKLSCGVFFVDKGERWTNQPHITVGQYADQLSVLIDHRQVAKMAVFHLPNRVFQRVVRLDGGRDSWTSALSP